LKQERPKYEVRMLVSTKILLIVLPLHLLPYAYLRLYIQLFSTGSTPALVFSQPLIHLVPEVMEPGRGDDRSLNSTYAEIKNA